MGASIQLFDPLGKLVAHTATTADGQFAFFNLPASLYSIRVTFADYLPATRERISILGGVNSLLQIHLASLMSSVELQYKLPGAGMSNDWKWVLRTSPATRPVTRFQPAKSSSSEDSRRPVFTGTRAVVSLASGDVNVADPDYAAPAVGTGFVLSTNVLGKNQLGVSGSVAQTSGLNSAMGLSATYARLGDFFGSSPEVRVTMEQIGVVNGPNEAAANSGGMPNSVRTMEVSVYHELDIGGVIRFEYGATGQTVDYFNRNTHASPFARLTRSLGGAGQVTVAFSDGARPDELRMHQTGMDVSASSETGEDLAAESNALARLPELSYKDNRLQVQRTLAYEAGYQKKASRQTYALSAFSEDVRNGRVDVAGNTSALNSADLMWDGVSSTSIYNIGKYARQGVLATADERITDWLQVQGGFGRMGALLANDSGASSLTEESRNIATTSVRARVPRAHTRLIASYGWTDRRAIIPQHIFTTQNAYASPGLNVIVRQPLPSLFGMPGRIELSADLRNLLAQGYVPLNGGSGQTLLMVQTPRAVRGGVNFTF